MISSRNVGDILTNMKQVFEGMHSLLPSRGSRTAHEDHSSIPSRVIGIEKRSETEGKGVQEGGRIYLLLAFVV